MSDEVIYYFAYGSNMAESAIISVAPSAKRSASPGWRITDWPSPAGRRDGTRAWPIFVAILDCQYME